MKRHLLVWYVVCGIMIAGCASTMEMGTGGSAVTGAAGNNGTQGESKQLMKCEQVVATVEVDDPSDSSNNPFAAIAVQMGLPSDPKPLMKLILAQTGCFTVVDRTAGLRAAKREHELREAGLVRKDSSVKKGNVVEAQYTLIPQVIFSQKQSSARGLGAIAGFIPIPGASLLGAAAGGISSKSKEAQVMLTIVNNETLIQEGVAEGSAKSTDVGFGGGLFGASAYGVGGAGVGGWNNTDQGKVVAAALMDATNKLVPILKHLQVPKAQPVASTESK